MCQHATQDTDEDDKRGRAQPAPHQYRLHDIVGEPDDRLISK